MASSRFSPWTLTVGEMVWAFSGTGPRTGFEALPDTFFLFLNQHQVTDIDADLHYPYLDLQVAFVVRQSHDFADLV